MERYTEKLRRVIFFAGYEARKFGSPCIETEHLLLGLLREDAILHKRFIRPHSSWTVIWKQIEDHTAKREEISAFVDLPFSNECKQVLLYTAEEAGGLSNQHIGTEHLLLGLMRDETCYAGEILRNAGLNLTAIRQALEHLPHDDRGFKARMTRNAPETP
jgi:ATP-dependent Clp protease ATP-binding subunit ClpC